MSANLYELLSKPFQEFSDSVAIECHERGIWTYGELEEQTLSADDIEEALRQELQENEE